MFKYINGFPSIISLLLLLSYSQSLWACDDSSVSLVSQNYDGTNYTYVIRMCLEYTGSFDPPLSEFQLTVEGGVNIVSQSPASFTHSNGTIYTGATAGNVVSYDSGCAACPSTNDANHPGNCYDITIVTDGIPTQFVGATNTNGTAWECTNRVVVIGNAQNFTCASLSTFTDPGGSGNYGANEAETYIICPDNTGDVVTVNFTSFDIDDTFSSCLDALQVYNGGEITTDNLIGSYCNATGSPGNIVSSAADGCLSFSFVSDGSGSGSGWNATVSCGAVVPVCGSVFTDGPGNYPNNANTTYNLCPDVPGGVITVTFTSFSLEDSFSGACYDDLEIFDGPTTSASSLGLYCGTNLPGPFTSTDPSGCLTFVLTSDFGTAESGWEADVTCGNCDLVAMDAGPYTECLGTAINIASGLASGTPNGTLTYAWTSTPASAVSYLSSTSSPSPTVSASAPAGTATYTLTINDDFCSVTDDVVINVLPNSDPACASPCIGNAGFVDN